MYNVYPPASCDEGNVTLLSGNNALEFSGGAETPKWKFRKFVTRNVQLYAAHPNNVLINN